MYIYTCVYLHILTSLYMCIYTYMFIDIYIHMHMYMYTCRCVYVYLCLWTYIHIHIYICSCLYKFNFICIHAFHICIYLCRVHMQAHMHTNVHTLTHMHHTHKRQPGRERWRDTRTHKRARIVPVSPTHINAPCIMVISGARTENDLYRHPIIGPSNKYVHVHYHVASSAASRMRFEPTVNPDCFAITTRIGINEIQNNRKLLTPTI